MIKITTAIIIVLIGINHNDNNSNSNNLVDPEVPIYLNAQTLCRPTALWQSPLIAAAQRRLERRLGKRKVGFKLLAVP